MADTVAPFSVTPRSALYHISQFANSVGAQMPSVARPLTAFLLNATARPDATILPEAASLDMAYL